VWTKERKESQKAACAASAAARRCKVCGRGAAMRLVCRETLKWECRYCLVTEDRGKVERLATPPRASAA
jgi:pyruvate formate-lyase activating enzyme-like uncharacterized protein